MRIKVINTNTTTSMTDTIVAAARAAARPGTEILGATSSTGPVSIEGHYDEAVAAIGLLQEVRRGEEEGCDAYVIACFGDPGLLALRELSNVPVVGMAEASCVAAATHGRFSIVTGGALWEPMLTEFVAAIGLADRLASVRTVAPTGGEIARNPAAALASLAEACTACATQDGAEVVILGGAALAGLAARIQPDVPVPVWCSVERGTRAVIAAAAAPYTRENLPEIDSVGLGDDLAKSLRGA